MVVAKKRDDVGGYPKLVISNVNNLVVFKHNAKSGMVVYSGNAPYDAGCYGTTWDDNFTDFHGTIELANS